MMTKVIRPVKTRRMKVAMMKMASMAKWRQKRKKWQRWFYGGFCVYNGFYQSNNRKGAQMTKDDTTNEHAVRIGNRHIGSAARRLGGSAARRACPLPNRHRGDNR
ncbi:MAG: hypothetical protein ACR2P4_09050 [Gammaproteobacteria bacterium]